MKWKNKERIRPLFLDTLGNSITTVNHHLFIDKEFFT